MSMFGFGDGFDAMVVHEAELDRIARECAQAIRYGKDTASITTDMDLSDEDWDWISNRITELVM